MSKKIKTATIFRIGLKDDEVPVEKNLSKKYSYVEYDTFGNVVLEEKYDEEGMVEEKYVYKYDDQGKLIEELTYLTEDEIVGHKTFDRDENGEITKAYVHYHDGSYDTEKYTYNAAGKLLEKITIDTDGEYESKETSIYENDRIIKREEYDGDELILEETFEYDDDGNLAGHTKWSVQEDQINYVNSFDGKGNVIKSLKYNNLDQLIGKTTYTYNDQGKIAQITEEMPHTTATTKIIYDTWGNAIQQTETNENGLVNNHVERKYNENNQTIESKVTINFHGTRIDQKYLLKYEYEYFD
ncbi:MAG: hypothetical protein JW731_09240 [Bacteroidales bacterium]|nr:hypothetical protein [Bacteroidales bacterium]